LFDDLEAADMRKRVKTFPKVLEREAEAIYRIANQLDRTGKLGADVDLSIYAARDRRSPHALRLFTRRSVRCLDPLWPALCGGGGTT